MSKDYQYKKKYRESPKGKKAHKIASWKYQGIISSDWDLLYEKFINTTHCGLCNIELIEGKKTNSRCLDHDHDIKDGDNVRYILCHKCNNNHDRKPRDLVNFKNYQQRYKKQKYKYQSSWGGDKRTHNNLLTIDPNLFF
tara:strand:- start:169 stop:585 length:417 start_codon:yes stop_codon:yes gene_type:complete